MYRTITQAALSAALAACAFAQTPQTPHPTAPKIRAATADTSAIPSDAVQSFRGNTWMQAARRSRIARLPTILRPQTM